MTSAMPFFTPSNTIGPPVGVANDITTIHHLHFDFQLTEASSINIAKQLSLKDKFALLVLLGCLKCFVIFPPNYFLALTAGNVANNVTASCHMAFVWLASFKIDDVIEEICFAMLSSEMPADDVFVIRQVRFAVLAPINLAATQIRVIRQPHGNVSHSPQRGHRDDAP